MPVEVDLGPDAGGAPSRLDAAASLPDRALIKLVIRSADAATPPTPLDRADPRAPAARGAGRALEHVRGDAAARRGNRVPELRAPVSGVPVPAPSRSPGATAGRADARPGQARNRGRSRHAPSRAYWTPIRSGCSCAPPPASRDGPGRRGWALRQRSPYGREPRARTAGCSYEPRESGVASQSSPVARSHGSAFREQKVPPPRDDRDSSGLAAAGTWTPSVGLSPLP